MEPKIREWSDCPLTLDVQVGEMGTQESMKKVRDFLQGLRTLGYRRWTITDDKIIIYNHYTLGDVLTCNRELYNLSEALDMYDMNQKNNFCNYGLYKVIEDEGNKHN